MKTLAAVAFEAKKPLEIVELDLEGPKAGEVLVEIKATGICHTDAYTLDGFDSEGIFPSILGHEGAGIAGDRRLSRDGPCSRGACAARCRPGSQGVDHPARHRRARLYDSASDRGPILDDARGTGEQDGRVARGARRRVHCNQSSCDRGCT